MPAIWCTSRAVTTALLAAGLLASPLPGRAAPADTGGWAGDCPTTLKMHGLLSRARAACGFRLYSERMLRDVGQCRKSTAKGQVTAQLTSGVKLFDAIEKKQGHKAACGTMAQKFPMVVQP